MTLDNFLLQAWFELKLSDPFTHNNRKGIRKFQPKPLVGSKVRHFQASLKMIENAWLDGNR